VTPLNSEFPFFRALIAIEGAAGIAHDLAGVGDVAQLGSEIEQPDLVLDDVLVETAHAVTFRFMVSAIGAHFYQNR
jgi:hypothetical protein